MDKKLLAWLLICVSMYLVFSSMQRNQEIARIEQEKKAEQAERIKKSRLEEAKANAERIAKEDPTFVMPEAPPRSRYTLGSMDPNDKYPFAVTLDNQGATIERIELVQQTVPNKLDYRSLRTKEREGYLGYLALEESQSTLVIGAVPKGSPAANAVCAEQPGQPGLQPGDKIVGWDELSGFPTLHKLDKRLSNQPAGRTIELTIERASSVAPSLQAGENHPNAQAEIKSNEELDDAPAAPKKLDDAPKNKLTFTCTLSERPLDVLRAEDDFLAEQVKGNDPAGSCATTLAAIDQISIVEGERSILGLERTIKGTWSVKPLDVANGMGVEYSIPLREYLRLAGAKANLELVKQYRLYQTTTKDSSKPLPREHHLELTTIVRNLDDEAHSVAIRQDGLNGVSLEGWWYPTKISPFFFSAAGARDLIVSDGFASHTLFTTRTAVSHAISFPSDPDMPLFGPADTLAKRSVNYIGLDTQTFTAAMLPSPDTPEAMKNLARAKAIVLNSVYADPNALPASKQQAANVGFWFETSSKIIPPKGEWKLDYQIFAGPKDPALLTAYKLDEALDYGWHIFGFFAKRLGWVLHLFFWVTGNFGIAIMMLTVLVRSLMFPVSRKMALNAQKMQSVQPHMAKLKESLKDDPRKMMAAQQMLMKKAGINQFAGCLPAMIQLPIVIGLYRCVSVDVGLRQQSLVPGWDWCSNLAGPDMFMDWQSWMPDFIAGRGSGWFGPYLNILPLVTITLFIIQQKVLMPKATDEQTRIAQQMMMMMTVMMGVLFFRVPAGLCIYFITSSTWSLVERFLIKRFTPKASLVDLPDSTATDILSALSKGGGGTQPMRSTTPSNEDRPKLKATKPPENFADLWEGFFGKKQAPAPATNENVSGKRPPPTPQRRAKKKKK
ncbi:MAG: YidC/Oxa1 family insertase periplasmic-domain containing protein [Pirellula sp.]